MSETRTLAAILVADVVGLQPMCPQGCSKVACDLPQVVRDGASVARRRRSNRLSSAKEDLRPLRLVHVVSALRSVCASAISGNSGVGEKPLSADARKA
jgi:hypothetical protein